MAKPAGEEPDRFFPGFRAVGPMLPSAPVYAMAESELEEFVRTQLVGQLMSISSQSRSNDRGTVNCGAHESLPKVDPVQAETIARLRRPRIITVLGGAAVTGVIVASVQVSQLSIPALASGVPNILDFLSRMFPPDWSDVGTAIALMWETFGIAVTGTLIGMLLAIPCGPSGLPDGLSASVGSYANAHGD